MRIDEITNMLVSHQVELSLIEGEISVKSATPIPQHINELLNTYKLEILIELNNKKAKDRGSVPHFQIPEEMELSIIKIDQNVKLRLHSIFSSSVEKTILFVSPIGNPNLIFLPLVSELINEKYNIILWEPRGTRSIDVNIEKVDCSFDAHFNDLKYIIKMFNLKEFHIVGCSSSSSLALKALSSFRNIRTYTSIVGTFPSQKFPLTKVMDKMARLGRDYVKGKDYMAGHYSEFAHTRDKLLSDHKEIELVGQSLDREIAQVAAYAISNLDDYFCHSKLISHWAMEKCESLIQDVKTPCLFICGAQDNTANNQATKFIHDNIKNSVYLDFENDDHFLFLKRPGVVIEHLLKHLKTFS